MKQILLICTLLISMVGYSQTSFPSYIGYSNKDLHNIFKDIKRKDNIQGNKCYEVSNNEGIRTLILIDDKIVSNVFVPSSEVKIAYVKHYDAFYIKLAPKLWENYIKEGIIQVSLDLEEGIFKFTYQLKKY